MLHTLTEGTGVTTLVYGPERQRITREFANGSTDATTTYLDDPIAAATSEKQGSGSSTVWRDYLSVDGRRAARWEGFEPGQPCRLSRAPAPQTASETHGPVLHGRAFEAWRGGSASRL